MEKLLEIDETKLSHDELMYLDQELYFKFHTKNSFREECRMILNIREKLGLDIQDNCMHSDFEYAFDERYKPIR